MTDQAPVPDDGPAGEVRGLAAQLAAGQAALHAAQEAAAAKKTRRRRPNPHAAAPASPEPSQRPASRPAESDPPDEVDTLPGEARATPPPTAAADRALQACPPTEPIPVPPDPDEPSPPEQAARARLMPWPAIAPPREAGSNPQAPVEPDDAPDPTAGTTGPPHGSGDPPGDVVALVAELAARARQAEADAAAALASRARQAEADAAAARAELATLTAEITRQIHSADAPPTTAPAGTDDPAAAPADVDPPAARRHPRRRRVLTVLVVAVACGLAGGALWVLRTPTPDASGQAAPSPTPTATAAPAPTPDREPAEPDPEPDPDAVEEPPPVDPAAEAAPSVEQPPAAAEAPASGAGAEQRQSQAAQPGADGARAAEQAPAQIDAAPVPAVERLSTQQAISCSAPATVVFTATGGERVDLAAAGQSTSGTGSAVLTVQTPGSVTATASAGSWVRITFDWTAPGGTCS